MFDVNDLKKTNDHFGHAAGDQLLVSIAEAVRGVLQEGDVLCRLSGDEFLALMRGAPREQAVQRMNTALQPCMESRRCPSRRTRFPSAF